MKKEKYYRGVSRSSQSYCIGGKEEGETTKGSIYVAENQRIKLEREI